MTVHVIVGFIITTIIQIIVSGLLLLLTFARMIGPVTKTLLYV